MDSKQSRALLLFFSRMTLLGALLLGMALTNVVALDLAYDIRGPLMIASLLLFLDLFILGPDLSLAGAVRSWTA